MIKVGDKVEYVGRDSPVSGKEGNVVFADIDGTFLVNFLGFTEGHSGRLCPFPLNTDSGWWCSEYSLKVVK